MTATAATPVTYFTCRVCGKHKSRHSASERATCSAAIKTLTLNHPPEKEKPRVLPPDTYYDCLVRKVR